MNAQIPVSIYSPGFWKYYLVQMRPYLFFVSGIAGLSGLALNPHFKMNTVSSLFIFLAFFFSYGFGQALTDCFQTDTDKISAPYRPLSKGILSIKNVKYVSIIGLILVTSILIFNNMYNMLFCTLSIIGLWSYSYFKRNYWFAGPFYNAWIVALLVIMGYLAGSGTPISLQMNPDILIVLSITFFSYANFVLIGYLKDITADKQTGYKTFPVVFGWNKTIWIGDIILLVCAFFYFQYFPYSLSGAIFGVMALVFGISGQLYAHLTRTKSEENGAFSILCTVRSFLLWHAGIISSFHNSLIIFCIVFYLLFEIIVYFRPMNAQI